jgi:hypothetical protein
VLMFLGEINDNRPLAYLTQQVNPHKIMQHPTCRRMLNPFPCLVGKRGLMRFNRLADAVFQGCVYSQAYRHHHSQSHHAFGLFEIERGGQKARVFHTSKAAFRMHLASLTFLAPLGWPWYAAYLARKALAFAISGRSVSALSASATSFA